jgi:hypothetical protein
MSSVVSLEIEDLNLKEMKFKAQMSVRKTENNTILFRKQNYTTYISCREPKTATCFGF